jgi:biotin operon repressor
MSRSGQIHAADVKSSDRLQRVLAVLTDRKPHSTLEIIQQAGVCAVNSCIAELRINGYDIRCRQAGRERFEYTLIDSPEAAA